MLNPEIKRWHEVAMSLRLAYWAMHRHSDACLMKRGVTANQFVLLALLAEADGIMQQELVRRASSDPSTIRAMLVLLEKQGFVSRGRDPEDGRAVRVKLTRKGRRAYEQMWADTQSVRERLLAVLKPEQSEALVQALLRVADAMNAGPR